MGREISAKVGGDCNHAVMISFVVVVVADMLNYGYGFSPSWMQSRKSGEKSCSLFLSDRGDLGHGTIIDSELLLRS